MNSQPMFLECIGFSGTHTITSILNEISHVNVSHGSRNFLEKTPIGINDVSLDDFTNQLLVSKETSKNIAIHTNMDPKTAYPTCLSKGIEYKLLVREPVSQINSCYNWAAKKLLQGDKIVLSSALSLCGQIGIEETIPNGLFLFSLFHVMNFNMTALSLGVEVAKMENILGSSEDFANLFGLEVEDVKNTKYFSGESYKISSYSSKISKEILPDIQENKMYIHILNNVQFNYKLDQISLEEYREIVGY